MKHMLAIILAGALFLNACSDEEADKKEGDEQVSPPVENSGAETETRRATEAVQDSPRKATEDTTKTTISVGKGGASVKTKSGKGVAVDDKGVRVESKKVKVDIKRDTN